MRCVLIIALLSVLSAPALAQTRYLGADLSYVNQMEDCGAVYRENGAAKDVYQIFADHGTNLVRVRLWVDPSWQNRLSQPPGVKSQYSDLEDVRETIQRSQDAGMQVLLDFHYSDFWADPGRQVVPSRWAGIANVTDVLADSVYQYTARVLAGLDADGLMPELVQVGNETNPGMLVYQSMNSQFEGTGFISSDWGRQAVLFNAAIRAVREVGATASVSPKIVIHFANPNGALSRVRTLVDNGVTDFDIIGLSFYYAHHGQSVSLASAYVSGLVKQLPDYDVAIVETGYLWSTQNHDSLPNIINTADPAYLPVSPRTQLEYQVDLTRRVFSVGGVGVIFWEPAWVSTDCRTPWGQGSSHDHVAFFDPADDDFIADGGGRWSEPEFYQDLDAPKTRFKVDMTGQNVSGGVYLDGDLASGGNPIPMSPEGGGIYSTFLHLPEGARGIYFFQTGAGRESIPSACSDSAADARRFSIGQAESIYGFVWGNCTSFGTATAIEDQPEPGFALHPAAPNPVSSSGMIRYQLPRAGPVHLAVYDLLGRSVQVLVQGIQAAGSHEAQVEVNSLPAGVYLYRLSTPVGQLSRVLTVAK